MAALFMRSKLFVPGSRPELFAKALASAADAVSIDLEDAVPEASKAEARANVAAFLRSDAARDAAGTGGKLIVVRINAIASPHFEADLAAIAWPTVSLVNLPKAEGEADVRHAAAVLGRAEGLNAVAHPIGLLANIETPTALRRAAEIGAAHARVVALQLGLGDLFEPFGIDRHDTANVHAAMFALRMAAAEAGVAACDGAFANLADEAGFRSEAAMSRGLGFIGKSCIHPKQVAWANEAFAPNAAEIDAARRIVEAARLAHLDGRAAFVVDGRMIDPPFLARAHAVLASVRDGPLA